MGVPPCSSKQLLRALKKVGFEIKYNLGDGSHIKAIDPRTGRSILIPHSKNLSFVRNGIVKKAVELGYSKKEIIKNL